MDREVYNLTRPIAAATPTLYGTPKIHKNRVPLRPILVVTLTKGQFGSVTSFKLIVQTLPL